MMRVNSAKNSAKNSANSDTSIDGRVWYRFECRNTSEVQYEACRAYADSMAELNRVGHPNNRESSTKFGDV